MANQRQKFSATPREPLAGTEVLVPAEAAFLCRLSVATMSNLRATGKGPPFFRAGRKLIRYRREDVMAWLLGDGPLHSTAEANARDRETQVTQASRVA